MKAMRFGKFLVVLLVGANFAVGAADLFQIRGSDVQYVTAEPVTTVQASPARPIHVILKFQVGEGYHVNSSQPRSDLLIPTQLKLNAPTGISVAQIVYPAGKDFSLSFSPKEKLSVYSGEFAVETTLKVLRAAAGTYRVEGELDYQACSDRACFPPKKLPVGFEVTVLKPQPKNSSSVKY